MIFRKFKKNEDILNFDSLRSEVLNLIPNFTELNELPKFKELTLNNSSSNFISEKVNIKEIDYFFSNAISRASKTMSECRQIKNSLKKTGTSN